MKIFPSGPMSSSFRSLVAVSAVATMALMSVPAVDAYNSPFKCPESRYSALKENYLSGEDDQYSEYEGAPAPYNWDVNWCGSTTTSNGVTTSVPGIVHYPSHVEPIVLNTQNFYNNPHGIDLFRLIYSVQALQAGTTTLPFGYAFHTWVQNSNGDIDWDYDGTVDWNIFGSAEATAVSTCRGKWFSNSQPANFHMRTSYRQVRVHRARNCKNDKHPQWEPYNGDASPLRVWDDAGVSKDLQRRLSFSVLNKPARQNVKYIAFFVNGMESCKGYPQSATGSDDGWKINIVNRDNSGSCNNKPKRDPHEGYKWTNGDMYISKHGLAAHYLSQAGSPNTYGQDLTVFPLAETLVINVPDAAFGYPGMPTLYNLAGYMGAGKMVKRCNVKNSFNDNKKLLEGWVNWLDYKVDWGNIKGFYGVGASRGGCFVTKMADILFQGKLKYNGAKLILETIDPVCAPSELDDYRYTDGFSKQIDMPDSAMIYAAFAVILGLSLLLLLIPGVNIVAALAIAGFGIAALTWTSGDASILAASPLANIGDDRQIVYPKNHNDNWKEQNQCHIMKLDKMFGNMPREDIRWLNTLAGENVLGGNVDWTTINAFCSDKTMGPATNIHTGLTVVSDSLQNGSVDETAHEDIKPKGSPKEWQNRFSRNEDGNPIGQGLYFQNLWLDFENNAFVSGPTGTNSAEWEVNPVSWESVSTTWDAATGWPTNPPNPTLLPKSNNPMPGFGQHSPACGSWYKQAWTPFNHLLTTAAIYTPANPYADGVGVPCYGQASCGYGVHEPANADGTFPLPLQKREVKVKNCVPSPRADLDVSYKHSKHAHDAAQELLASMEPAMLTYQIHDCPNPNGPCVNMEQVFQGWEYGTGAPVYGEICPQSWTDAAGVYGPAGTTYPITAEYIDLGLSTQIQGYNDWTEWCYISKPNPNYAPPKKCRKNDIYSGEEWTGPAIGFVDPIRFGGEVNGGQADGIVGPAFHYSGEEVGADGNIEVSTDKLTNMYDTEPITGETLDVVDESEEPVDIESLKDLAPKKEDEGKDDDKDREWWVSDGEGDGIKYYYEVSEKDDGDFASRLDKVEVDEKEIAVIQVQVEKYAKANKALIDRLYPSDEEAVVTDEKTSALNERK